MPGCCVQRWSISLGRWWGITVYLHLFFIISAVLALAFAIQDSDLLSIGALTVLILLVSVLLHELGHAVAAVRVGGKVDAIVLGPVGGLISPRVPDEPEALLFVALAAPIVHLLLAVLAAIVLALAGDTQLLGLLNPVAPQDLIEGGTDVTARVSSWAVAVKLTLWINWVLMLLNLLPAYPFDGGPILRAALWPAVGRRTARIVTARVAMVVAVLICGLALWTIRWELPTSIPMWMPLVMLGLFLYFSARQDMAMANSKDPTEWPEGYDPNCDSVDMLDTDWLTYNEDEGVLVEHGRRQESETDQRVEEASEDARVDDILARLHNSSWEALSAEEIAVLQRASQRYRRRRHRPKDASA